MLTARFPVYIPSKSRADVATTPGELDRMGVPYRLIVEGSQVDAYAARFGADRVLALPQSYLDDYPTCDEGRPAELGKGSGPPRNFAWDHSLSEGHEWHWEMDDNIMAFYQINRNVKLIAGDGSIFHAMEEFATRWRNVGMAGPEYDEFVPARQRRNPFSINRKLYSCLLIRNAVPLRWECRYNEDVDIGLRMMKSGWLTLVFYTFLQDKGPTQRTTGGNTEGIYAQEGTLNKSKMLVTRHPDVARVQFRYNRWHHVVTYVPFAKQALLPDPDFVPSGVTYRYEERPQTESLYSSAPKMTTRAREDITLGYHPLLAPMKGRLPNAELHPEADRSGVRANPDEPFRCGSCRFRLQFVNGPHQYLYKCGFGQLPNGSFPRASGRHDNEIRLWWPACKDYVAGSVPLNGWARERA
jgi:hypothetical protein